MLCVCVRERVLFMCVCERERVLFTSPQGQSEKEGEEGSQGEGEDGSQEEGEAGSQEEGEAGSLPPPSRHRKSRLYCLFSKQYSPTTHSQFFVVCDVHL
jgi:hypothetical protein